MSEKSFALFFAATLGLLLIPIPPWMIDICVVLNLAFSIILFLGVFKLSSPLKLYTLPTLILLLTLFRLCLNIATSRSILASGEAGQIVERFGSLANAGDIAVGVVIFILITIVQIIVVTKGAERVAEVSARFTLDALPGKQMSIDADLRAGLIDLDGARSKREELQIESRFHGALDGAMKFVKGDAIAGAIITLVNLLGGAALGSFRDQLSWSDVLTKYSMLTIGDGLVAQLSSFSCAVAAGVMVTRVTKEGSPGLSADLLGQLLEIRLAGLTVGGLLICLGFMPGAPHVTLIMCGVGVVWFFLSAKRLNERRGLAAAAGGKERENIKHPFKLNPLLAIRVSSASQITPIFAQELINLRQRLWVELGIPIPTIDLELRPDERGLGLALRGEVIWRNAGDANLEQVEKIYEEILRVRGELVDDQLTQRLCDIFETECSSLIAMVIPQLLTVTGLTNLLRALVEDEISLRNFDVILQVVAERVDAIGDRSQILEEVRIRLRRSIQAKIKNRIGEVPQRLTIDPILDICLIGAKKSGQLPEARVIDELVRFARGYVNHPVIMAVSKSSREMVRDILRIKGVGLDVFAHEELVGLEFGNTDCLRPSWIEELV